MLNILQNNSMLSQQGYWQINIDQPIDLFRFPALLGRLCVCVCVSIHHWHSNSRLAQYIFSSHNFIFILSSPWVIFTFLKKRSIPFCDSLWHCIILDIVINDEEYFSPRKLVFLTYDTHFLSFQWVIFKLSAESLWLISSKLIHDFSPNKCTYLIIFLKWSKCAIVFLGFPLS